MKCRRFQSAAPASGPGPRRQVAQKDQNFQQVNERLKPWNFFWSKP